MELSDDDGLQYLRAKHSEYFADDWSVPRKQGSANTMKSPVKKPAKKNQPSAKTRTRVKKHPG